MIKFDTTINVIAHENESKQILNNNDTRHDILTLPRDKFSLDNYQCEKKNNFLMNCEV